MTQQDNRRPRRNSKTNAPTFLGKSTISGDGPPPSESPGPEVDTSGPHLETLDPNLIQWPEVRISSEYNPAGLQELGDSLAGGQEDPIIVRQMPNGDYVGAGGMNRCLAAIAQGLQVEAFVRPGDETDVVHANLRTAVQQSRPNPLSEVQGIASAIFDTGLTVDQVMADTSKSQEWVETRVEISESSPVVLECLGDGTIVLGHAALLAKVRGHEDQEDWLHKVRQYGWSVKELERELSGANTEQVSFPATTRNRKTKKCGGCAKEGEEVQAVVCEACLVSLRKVMADDGGELVTLPSTWVREAVNLLAGSPEGTAMAERIGELLEV